MDQILRFLTIFWPLMVAFVETSPGNFFFAGFKVVLNIILRFNQSKNSFITLMVFQSLIKSLLIDRFFLEDSHLNNKRDTFINDSESIWRYGVTILAWKERESMQSIWTDFFLHFKQFSEYAPNRPHIDRFIISFLKQDNFWSSVPSCCDSQC